MVVEKGKKVKIRYEGKLESGQVFDKSQEDKPLEFTAGTGQVIPGFDHAVLGMEVGEEKEFTIDSDNAYGSRNEELVKSVSRSQLPEGLEPEEGMMLQTQNPSGQVMPVKVVGVEEEDIKIDFNHPLAGQNLFFNVKVIEINEG